MSDSSRAAKVLTIMMTDVVGSTALRRARGDRIADDILGLQAAIVQDQVTASGGRVSKSLGDGFLISFPSTVAAVRAAAAIQRSLHEHNEADPQRAVEIRIGITIGRVREHDGDVSGQAVYAAARVMDEAIGGQILTSDEVRKHAEPQLDWAFLDLGLFWLRGFPERWRLYEVSWNDASAGVQPRAEQARLTPSVEREAERASLRRLLDDALSGHGRLVLVAGEAGIGKSRLVTEIGDVAQARGMRDAHRALRGDERGTTVLAVRGDDRTGDQQPAPLTGTLERAWQRGRGDRAYRAGAAARLSEYPATS